MMIGLISTPCPRTSTMPHRIFEIDELTMLISRHLVSIGRKSTVSLACTCRLLETPALSSLWEVQGSLPLLFNVSPRMDEEVCDGGFRTSRGRQEAGRDSRGNSWDRFRRYATWRRQLWEDGGWMTNTRLGHLLTGSTDGFVCPNLRSLT